MSDKRCPQCGKRYSSSYRSCPYCSGRSRGRRSAPDSPIDQIAAFFQQNGERVFLGVTAFFLLIALLGMVLTRCSGNPEPGSDPDDTQPSDAATDPQPETEPLVISKQTLALTVGESAALTVEGGADQEGATVWTSSNEDVVSVVDGVVTANASGAATVTAARGSEQAFCTVTVKEKDPDVEVYLNRTDFTLRAGENFQMQVKVKDTKKVYTGSVVWSVEDPGIATVSETGLVERVSKGTTKVIATMGSKTLECIVRVA